MSFKANTEYKGIQIQDAYFNINAVGGTKDNVIIELNCYATEELYNHDKVNNTTENKLFADTSLSFIPDVKDGSENWIKQAYECTQLLEKYPNKVDC